MTEEEARAKGYDLSSASEILRYASDISLAAQKMKRQSLEPWIAAGAAMIAASILVLARTIAEMPVHIEHREGSQ